MVVSSFTMNGFAENTFVLYDDSKECVIIDPGCNNAEERQLLVDFIESNELKPVKLVNTHCHIDHVLGNDFISKKYNLPLISHKGEQVVLDNMETAARIYNIPYDLSPDITVFIDEGEFLKFGNTSLEIYFAPGHSPAHIVLFHRETNQLIAGDVLFQRSIGRTDLPGGDYDTLIKSIKTKLLPLGDDVKVYCGHGPSTTIGEERLLNPFLQ